MGTRYDAFCGPGGRVSEAAALAGHADRLVTAAVIYERERGTSWADIGRYLDLDGPAAQQRFAAAVEQWQQAFDVPYRLDATGRKRIPQLPGAAYDPASSIRSLDLWAGVRLLYDDKHAVSGGLLPDDEEVGPPETTCKEMQGRIRLSRLGDFLDLLSDYVRCDPTDEAREVVTAAMEDSADVSYTLEGVFETLDVRLTVDGDRVGVVVAGAHSSVLRLRISTLLDAYA